MNDPTDPYADIRPYRDDEVARVLQGLRDEPGLINTLAEWSQDIFAASRSGRMRRTRLISAQGQPGT